eukprot:6466812-Amphidinium_carterae.1
MWVKGGTSFQEELVEVARTKSKNAAQQRYIRSIAETMVGGPANLERCLLNGEATQGEQKRYQT